MAGDYFQRVTSETETRFWINNPTGHEAELALAAGAVACTTNPAYCSRLLKQEPAWLTPIIQEAVSRQESDDMAAQEVVNRASIRLLEIFRPLYDHSGGQCGFVTIQDDPHRDQEAAAIVAGAIGSRALGANFMAKIPVTRARLRCDRGTRGAQHPDRGHRGLLTRASHPYLRTL